MFVSLHHYTHPTQGELFQSQGVTWDDFRAHLSTPGLKLYNHFPESNFLLVPSLTAGNLDPLPPTENMYMRTSWAALPQV